MSPDHGRRDEPTAVDDDADDLADSALLATLRDRAAARNRERAAELVGWCDSVERDGRWDADGRARVRAVVHALAGSAGTFGHPEVSALAERVGAAFGGEDASPPTDGRVAEIRAVLAHITRLLTDDEPSPSNQACGGDSPIR